MWFSSGADTGFRKGVRGRGSFLSTKMRCIPVHVQRFISDVLGSPKRTPWRPPPPSGFDLFLLSPGQNLRAQNDFNVL